ncbi:MAG: DKNYY domain-containing protein [Elusimicrobiaceae bacterium]|nr:DKNYY domain-containing protein [Elusimicrobiaceae bacterium]
MKKILLTIIGIIVVLVGGLMLLGNASAPVLCELGIYPHISSLSQNYCRGWGAIYYRVERGTFLGFGGWKWVKFGQNLEVLGPYHAKDKRHVFFGADKIKSADPASFVIVKNYLGKDKNSVFNGTIPMIADANTFTTRDNEIVYDKNGILLWDQEEIVYDKNGIFLWDENDRYRQIKVDIPTLKVLGPSYPSATKRLLARMENPPSKKVGPYVGMNEMTVLRDKNGVYLCGRRVPADPATIRWLEEDDIYVDKNNRYSQFECSFNKY